MIRLSLIRLVLISALSAVAAMAAGPDVPELTPRPNGPYRIEGNRILDRDSRPYLIRGTQLAPLTSAQAGAFGPWSATALDTIRQRLNMNAARIPVSANAYNESPEYQSRVAKLVQRANRFELLAIVETDSGSGDLRKFWAGVAQQFRDNPNVFFAPLDGSFVPVIRGVGAHQPVIVTSGATRPDDPAIIYQASPSYADLKTEAGRDKQFASSADVPLLINGLDPQLDRASGECGAFPADPADAGDLVEANLAYFDDHAMSWTLSSLTPGKLITDYRYFTWTKLDPGWTCGQPQGAGIGMVLVSHLWSATPLGLFTVSHSRATLVIPRGGVASAYGPVFADKEMEGHGSPLPTRLGNVSVRVTDSHGVARLAPLLYTGAGWGFINFVMPDESAAGPAEVAVVRTDGSVATSKVLIADFGPAIYTVPSDGRSAAAGEVTQHAAGMADKSFPASRCDSADCNPVPIPLSAGVTTMVHLTGTGFGHLGEHPDIHATAGGVALPVVSVVPAPEVGNEQITLRIPDALRGAGASELYFTVNGQLSNVVQINFGAGK